MTKLTNKKIKYIINQVTKKNRNTKTVAEICDITRRRVQQLIREYKKNRKNTKIEEEQRGARLLYHELKIRGYRIPHNKIYTYLKQTGKTKSNPKKQKKRKRCKCGIETLKKHS